MSNADFEPDNLPSEDRPHDSRPHDSRKAAIEYDASTQSAGGLSDSSVSYSNMGWKGIDSPKEEEYEPDVSFGEKEKIPEDDLDMTPMIDVTFLLLIFFMVTASFTLQQSIEQPPAKSDDASTNVQEQEEIEEDYVEVIIDQTNTYYVTTRDAEEVEAPSDREMRSRVLDAKNNSTATRLIIRAHVDSMHKKVITAWDAGATAGMKKVEIKTFDEEF